MKKLPKRTKRVAVIFAIVLVGAGTTVMSVDALRAKFFNLFSHTQAKHTDFWFEPSSDNPPSKYQFVPYTISYVPEGYTLDPPQPSNSNQLKTSYTNTDGQSIIITQSRMHDYHFELDTENATIETTTINGYPAKLWSKNADQFLLFETDNSFFSIQASLGQDELLKMAESILLTEPIVNDNFLQYQITALPDDMKLYDYTETENQAETILKYKSKSETALEGMPFISLVQRDAQFHDDITMRNAQPQAITINGENAKLWSADHEIKIALKKDGYCFTLSTNLNQDLAISIAESIQKNDSWRLKEISK